MAASWSPVGNETFNTVFGLSPAAVAASMVAYLIAQFIDIRIFHLLKAKTKGKKLWLRNNISTISSQLADTAVVLSLLCWVGIIPWDKFWMLFLNGFLFKILFALFDTPIIYFAVWRLRKYFRLNANEDLSL
jgi:uncharacterized integral membrane protein (TIGR00697 family)